MYKYLKMAQPLISNNLNDFLSAIQTNLSCLLYYKTAQTTYKIHYKYAKNDIKLMEYKFIAELNNTFRLIKTIPIGDKVAAIELIKHWHDNNKNKIEILTKSESFLFQNKITESNSCWKSPEQLGKAVRNGLEVPNCIPDSEYDLKEAQAFITNKNRELIGKYKKAVEWLNTVIADGDKEYAEKLLQIVDKWKKYYEDKIRLAKTVLKETTDVVTSAEIIKDEKKKIRYYLKRSEKSYDFYVEAIKHQVPSEQEKLINKLNQWYLNTVENLKETLNQLNKTKDPTIQVQYTPFSLYNIDIMDLTESAFVKQEIARFVTKSNELRSDLAQLKKESGFNALSDKEKEQILNKFYKKHVKNNAL